VRSRGSNGLVARWLPHEFNPLAQMGAAANFALTVAVVSGVALLLWYSPSVVSAYTSVAAMSAGTLGGWVRALHRYSSDLAMLLIVLHATRIFCARKFAGARWLPWVSGIALITLVWFIGWTGYWLVWDQPAQQIAVTSMRLLDGLPIFGEPLGRLFVADRTVPSLLFFVVFFTHMLLPLGIAVGLAIHLTRVSRARLFPRRAVGAALLGGLALAALFVPAPIDAAAAMSFKPPAFTVDAWYLAPLALALRLQEAGLWFALLAALCLAALVPWLLGRRRPRSNYQAFVEQSRCHACTQCSQDCPFDAISMVPRTDGKRFASQAYVDPAKCVGCAVCAGSCDSEGIGMPWFDTHREEARLEMEIAADRRSGRSPWVALVSADIDGALGLVQLARWRDRLPGYQVHAVPTASWIRPRLVERLLQSGTRGVLIVRDARAEAAARDGNRWVEARLAGERAPPFRTARAGASAGWRVLDFDPARPGAFTLAANAFCGNAAPPFVSGRVGWPAWLVGGVIVVALGLATVAPSQLKVTNPVSSAPEFIFSFRAVGDRAEGSSPNAVADLSKPIHMRGRSVEKPHRADILVRVSIDGTTEERRFTAKGISRDGPALDEWRAPLAPGAHAIAIELVTGPNSQPQRWSGSIRAEPRRLHVISFEPGAGFRVER